METIVELLRTTYSSTNTQTQTSVAYDITSYENGDARNISTVKSTLNSLMAGDINESNRELLKSKALIKIEPISRDKITVSQTTLGQTNYWLFYYCL